MKIGHKALSINLNSKELQFGIIKVIQSHKNFNSGRIIFASGIVKKLNINPYKRGR